MEDLPQINEYTGHGVAETLHNADLVGSKGREVLGHCSGGLNSILNIDPLTEVEIIGCEFGRCAFVVVGLEEGGDRDNVGITALLGPVLGDIYTECGSY